MAQLFHPFTNGLARGTIFGGVVILGAIGAAVYAYSTSDYVTQSHVVRAQPVDFSHEHHVAGLGLDCRYCHNSVETQAFAGMPASEVCMNCHSRIWSDSPKLEPVRKSFRENTPLAWTRVTDLPDYVHFNHSIHVQKGMACRECHGQVDKMPLMWREHTLQMRWCLDCHRAPESHVGPRSEVFVSYTPALDTEERSQLASEYQLRNVTNCSACHY